VVTPGREELIWNLVVSVPDNFPDEGYCTKNEIIGVVVDGVVVPKGIKGTYCGGGIGDSGLDIVVVA